jgi:hypothetical protein
MADCFVRGEARLIAVAHRWFSSLHANAQTGEKAGAA